MIGRVNQGDDKLQEPSERHRHWAGMGQRCLVVSPSVERIQPRVRASRPESASPVGDRSRTFEDASPVVLRGSTGQMQSYGFL